MRKKTNIDIQDKMVQYIDNNEFKIKSIFNSFYSHKNTKLLRRDIKELFESSFGRFNLFVGKSESPVIGFKTQDSRYTLLYDKDWVDGLELKIVFTESEQKKYNEDSIRVYWYN